MSGATQDDDRCRACFAHLDTQPHVAGCGNDSAEDPRLQLVRDLDTALHGDTWARPQSPLVTWEALVEKVDTQRQALLEGRMALARAIGLLEAHWEVCADPFPDASLRRVLDRMAAAANRPTVRDEGMR